jgi:hypothetical protein
MVVSLFTNFLFLKSHPCPNGLVAAYTLDSGGANALDRTGFGNNMPITNADFINNGLRFNAAGEYAALDNTDEIVSGEKCTIVLNLKSLVALSEANYRTIFGRWGINSAEGNLFIGKNNNNTFSCRLYDDTTVHQIVLNADKLPGYQTGIQIAVLWNRLTAVLGTSKMAFNINGSHVTPDSVSNNTSWNPVTIDASLYLGNDSRNNTMVSQCIIYNTDIYNRVLSEAELTDIYESRLNRSISNTHDGISWDSNTIQSPLGSNGISTREHFSLCEHNSKVYLMGGWNGSSYLNDVYVTTNMVTWERLSDASWAGRGKFEAFSFDGKLWVIAGQNDSGYLRDTWCTSNGSNWEQKFSVPSVPRRRRGIVFNGKMYVL